jgi:hypothetical protein
VEVQLRTQVAIVLSMRRRLPVCGVLAVVAVLPQSVDRQEPGTAASPS